MKINKLKLNLLMARKEINFTELARISGVSRATISYINNGKQCRVDVACKIADALEVPIEELIEMQKGEGYEQLNSNRKQDTH